MMMKMVLIMFDDVHADDDDESDDANITATCLPPSTLPRSFFPHVRRWQTDERPTATVNCMQSTQNQYKITYDANV